MTPDPPYLSELASYVESHLDSTVDLRLALAALLSDPASYVDSRGQPLDALSGVVQEIILSDRRVQAHLADSHHPVSRQLTGTKWTAVWRDSRSVVSDVSPSFRYDVCISFAGSERSIAERIARSLTAKETKRKVFYDEFEKTKLWGENLFDYLHDIYSRKSLFCIILFSHQYRQRAWTRHELRSAQTRLLRDNSSYVLPVAIDKGAVPDEFSTIGFWTFSTGDEDMIADAAEEKINDYIGTHYFEMDLLVDLFSREQTAVAMLDGLREGVRNRENAGDQAGADALTILALIVACDCSRLKPQCRAIIDLVLFAEGQVGSHFDGGGRIQVLEDAYIMRWLGRDGPVLFGADGWKAHFDRYKERLDAQQDRLETSMQDDDEGDE